uniref:Uncharacterized protein n=1 Tax=Nelumbo nucifera TaxID=4432 RepID=A0A822YGT2_NELNU|nr:TPA_asm: hypothetical protein HUJ06_010194 [Nelumbo nucifera]
MVKTGVCLETYLFNPPFSSLPTEMIKHEGLRDTIRKVKNTSKFQLVTNLPSTNHSFVELSKWVPRLFLNKKDPICVEYKTYFESRDQMVVAGAGNVGHVVSQYTVIGVLLENLFDKKTDPLHLLPSADLIINNSDSQEAHALQKRWLPNLHLEPMPYRFVKRK